MNYRGCPKSLPWLQIQNCRFREIEKSNLKLNKLQILNLSHNGLKNVPLYLRGFALKELYLQHNYLQSFPDELAGSILGENLQVLDLSYNRIQELSPYFCLMKEIITLSLESNDLKTLPRNVHSLESLTHFNAAKNKLRVLPSGILKLGLVSLDLTFNLLDTGVTHTPVTVFPVLTLQELAAAAITKHNILCTAECLPKNLIDYIVEHSLCFCKKKVFRNSSSCILEIDQKIASNPLVNNTGQFKVPIEVFFCSTICQKHYRSMPQMARYEESDESDESEDELHN